MSDTLRETITIDRISEYKYELKDGSLVILFEDYNDVSILEHLFGNEYIEIEIRSSAFHYVVYISAEYIDRFVSKISLCRYRTTECIVTRNTYRISVYLYGSNLCVDSQCFDVQRVYPVELKFRVKTYNGNVPALTYRFTLERIQTIDITLDMVVMIVISAVIIMYVIQLISEVFT